MSIAEKLTAIAENVPKVYEAGKKAEYDKFWDENQDYGTRTTYSSAYMGNNGWTKDNFYPKYDIKPIGSAAQMFYAWEVKDKHSISLTKRLKECGVVLDTSQATNLQQAFAYCKFTELPTIDLTSLTNKSSGLFANSWGSLSTIEKIIVNENTQIASNWFLNTNITNITIEGTIGQSELNVSSCTNLTTTSLLSILTAISKDSTVASGKSITFATAHQEVIEGDAQCLEQLNLAVNAGWTVVYA